MRAGNAKLVTAAVILAGMVGASAAAADAAGKALLVIHVKDYQGVPAGELREAETVVQRVYTRIGVELVWTTGYSRLAPEDGNRHIDVLILDGEMTDRDAPDPNAFGKASMSIHRATVYFPRIVAHARITQSNPSRVLALVLAHEIGHTLLPEYSHTSSGLMRALWEGPIVQLPGFSRAQGELIRTTLASSN